MRRRVFATLALVPALALGLSGCGDDTGGGEAARAASDLEKMREYAQCMRDNGVDMPDPSADGRLEVRSTDGATRAGGGGDKVGAAQEKCRHLMPNGGRPPEPDAEEMSRMRAFAQCMRDNGITGYPDPEPDGGTKVEAGEGTGIDMQGRKFQQALRACERHAPGGDLPNAVGKD